VQRSALTAAGMLKYVQVTLVTKNNQPELSRWERRMPHATDGGQAAGKTVGTEEEVVGLPNGRAANTTTGRCSDVETSSEVLMPRGMNQATCTPEPCLRIIDTALLRSGSGSRSAAFGQDESMLELVASIASVGIIEPLVVRQVEANAFDIVAGERV
jgi:hypothetical protein